MTTASKLVVRTSDRPDLVPLIAHWLWQAFWRTDGYPLRHVHGLVAAATAPVGPPQTFVMLVDGEPVGTASLIAHDLAARPDLTPWLAGVFIAPAARRRDHVRHLIGAVEAAARAAAIPTLWLYTTTAERIYARAGWQFIESFTRCGEPAALMCRHLTCGHKPPDRAT
jgi:GNAT superfamily N-acetyltransferase